MMKASEESSESRFSDLARAISHCLAGGHTLDARAGSIKHAKAGRQS